MNVKELIQELKKYDKNLDVRIADWQEGCQSPMPLESHDVLIESSYIKYGDRVFLKLGNDDW